MLTLGVAEALGLLAALLGLVFYLLSEATSYWSRRGVAQISAVSSLAFTTMREFKGTVFQRWYQRARAEGLPYIGFYLGTKPALLITDPEMLKAVFVKDFAHFTDRGMPLNRKLDPLGANLFNLEGEEWRAIRHKLSPTFTSGKMKAMFPLVQACVQELDQYLRDQAARPDNVVEMFEVLARFTTDVIGSCAFGVSCNSLKDPDAEFRTMGRAFFDMSLWRALIAGPVSEAFPSFRKIFPISLTPRKINKFFIGMFNENIGFREKNNVHRGDFLDLLIEMKKKDGLTGMEDILPAQAFVFFLAGFETSSSSMGNCLTELSLHRDIQDRVREEVDRVLAKRGGQITYDSLHEMTYMEQVIEETMRLYPALAAIPRVVSKDYPLPGTKAVLPQRMRVVIPAYAIHRDPEFYPDPDNFNPDNFTEEAKQSRPQFTYMPFGDGPRICIGLRFAMMQMKMALAAILGSYEVLPCEEGQRWYPPQFQPKSFVSHVLGGNKVHLVARKA